MPARLPEGAFWVLLALHLAPVLSVTWIPMQDLPNHMDNGGLLLRLCDSRHELVDDYYRLELAPVPNLASTLLPAFLLLFLPLEIAQRVLVGAYVVGLPLAARYAIGALRPENRWVAMLVLPLVHGYIFQMGFIGFLHGLVLWFLLLGLWLRWSRAWTSARILAFAILAVLHYLTHAVPVIVLFVTTVVLEAHRVASAWPGARATARQLAPLTAFAPALLLFAWFTRSPIFQGPVTAVRDAVLPIDFALLQAFDGHEERVTLLLLAMAALLLLEGTWRLRESPRETPAAFWLALVATLAIYALSRDPLGEGTYLKPRLALFPFLVLVMMTAASPLSRRMLAVIPASVLLLGILHLPGVVEQYRAHEEGVREIVSLRPSIAEKSTVLPLCFSSWREDAYGRPSRSRIQAYLHAGAWLAADRDVVNLRNYSAPFWQFPVRYRPERDPYVHLSPAEKDWHLAPRVDLAAYETATGARVDHVVVWGLRPEHASSPRVRSLIQQIEARYTLVQVSPGRRAFLYRAKTRDSGG